MYDFDRDDITEINASDHVSLVQQNLSLLNYPLGYGESNVQLFCASLEVDDAMWLPIWNDRNNSAVQLFLSDTSEGMYGRR